KEDLERQKQYLLSQFLNHFLISDIGSSINFKRSGLRSLLERSSRGLIKQMNSNRLDLFRYRQE
ncbi:hypothetical protein RhiirA1_409244, partial [Rhizophagus irregularis]